MRPGSVRWMFLVGVVASLAAAPPRQSPLDAAAGAFARAWRSGDADAIAGALAPDGIRLHLGGVGHVAVGGRQARVAVGEFLAGRAPGRLDTERVTELGDERGSAEFRWRTVVHGTSEPVSYTIFVGFTRARASWRINEIRVF